MRTAGEWRALAPNLAWAWARVWVWGLALELLPVPLPLLVPVSVLARVRAWLLASVLLVLALEQARAQV